VCFIWVTPVSSTNKTDHHDIAEILLKVALNIITLTLTQTTSIGVNEGGNKLPVHQGDLLTSTQ